MSQHVDGDDEHKLLDSLGIPSAEPDGMGGSVFLSLESRIKLLAQQLAEARAQAFKEAAEIARKHLTKEGGLSWPSYEIAAAIERAAAAPPTGAQ